MFDHPTALSEAIRRAAVALKPAAPDYDPLLEWIGDARLVLLGEASHGTHEFYRDRAHITQRLIAERHFTGVAVEADWPDAYRVNQYVRGQAADGAAEEALRGFKRFPTWMWRNADVLDFVGWLRAHNDRLPATETRVGFYGLDLYSLSSSIEAVIRYLDKIDPEAARRARARYSCFEQFTQDTQAYGYAAAAGLIEPCENDVVAQLVELRRRAAEYAQRDGRVAEEEFFHAEQNARLAKNAEEYYRAMFRGRVSSWNLRDRHMVETLVALLTYLERRTTPVKLVVWAHNSHLGDARATEMGEHGELNVGQLVRERFGSQSRLIGFTTHSGTVTAASDWDAPAERKQVRPALSGSIERIFHDTGVSQFALNLRSGAVPEALVTPRLERAIGVIYRPETERASHYFHARLPEQFDAVIHVDHTRALEPLERSAVWHEGEPAETYPSGL
jgi:erythromycin esterase-like protein